MSLFVEIHKRLPGFTLDVQLEAGDETLGLLGSSGCGKSMTLKCIAGIDKPDKGLIVLNDRVLFDSAKGINLPPRERKTGYLFQNYALFPNMTVEENIAAGMKRVSKVNQSKMVAQSIDVLQLSGLEKRYPRQLSGGQQQRVAIARMLGSEPNILMFDEPFSALDQHLKEQTMPELLDVIERFGKTTLLVTHNIDEVYIFCSSVAVMSDGHVDVCGTKEKIFKNPGTVSAARITGAKNISRIQKTGDSTFLALDWGFELTTPEPVSEDFSHVCIRAHHLELLGQPSNLNCVMCSVEKTLESRFSKSVMLKSRSLADKGGNELIRFEADKKLFACDVETGDMVYVHFPPEKLIFLK